MSLMSFRRKLASKRTTTFILWGLIVVFLAGVALWSVPNRGRGAGDPGAARPGSGPVVAMVGEAKITAGDFESAYTDALASGGVSVTIENALQIRKQVFQNLVTKRLAEQGLKENRVRLNDGALRKLAAEYAGTIIADMRTSAKDEAKRQAEEAKKSKDAKKAKLKTADELLSEQLVQFANRQGGALKPGADERDFTRWFTGYLLDRGKGGQYASFADHGRMRLLGRAVIGQLTVNPFTVPFAKKLETKEVKASWIFIAAQGKTKASLAAAEAKAKALRQQIIDGKIDFAAAAKQNSEDFMTKANGGALGTEGWLAAHQQNSTSIMQEYMAFAQEPGKTVKDSITPLRRVTNSFFGGNSQLGYAFVKVDAVRDRKGVDKNTLKDGKLLVTRLQQNYEAKFGEDYVEFLRSNTKIKAVSPEVKAYMAEDEQKPADKFYIAALAEKNLQPAVKAALNYRVAQMPQTSTEDRILYLEEAIQFGASDNLAQLHLTLGREYAKNKEPESALEQFDNAAITASSADRETRKQLRDEYKKLGNAEGVQQMTTWLKEHPEQPQDPGMGFNPMMMGGQ